MAVERSGQLGNQLGLKRENSGEPSMAKRRTSFSIDEEEHPQTTAERKQSIATEYDARKNSTVVEETIPEVAVETPPIEVDKQLGGGNKGVSKSAAEKKDLKKAAASNTASNGHTNGSNKSATTIKTVDKPSSSKFTARPAPISTAKTAAASKPSPKTTKSPAAPKTPTTPRDRPNESTKRPEKKPEKKESKPAASSSNAPKPASKPATSSAHGANPKTRIPPSPPQTGFVKPKPRSPTRPIKLPASLTAHTASSGSKTAVAPPQTTTSRRSLSRASGNSQATNPLQTHATISRSPSRATTTTAPKSLTRKPSTLNKTHSRPSLGPPPAQLKKQPSRQSLPQSAPADEGFLARMMRPTTSSASKTAEKVTTPPKRAQSVKRPVTRDGPPKHEAPKAAAPKMGKLVSKPALKDMTAAASSDPEKAEEVPSQPAAVEEAKPEIPSVPKVPETHAQVADVGEGITQAAEAHKSAVEVAKAIEADLSAIDEATPNDEPILPALLEKMSKVESTPEKPATIEKPVAPTQEPTKKEEVSDAFEESVILKAKEVVSKKTKDMEAVKEAIETSKSDSEPVLEKAVEVEIPKEVKAVEDPEDVKAREEIAKLNAEVMKPSADDDVE